MDEEQPKRRPPISQLSKTPSWVMLGFILGALFVSALPRHEAPAPRPIVVAPEGSRRVTLERPMLTTIEAVFSDWADYAVWEDDTTQVALWNAAVGEFAEFYEVRRVDGTLYFRSIPHLTNPVLRNGQPLPSNCPLRFTESEAHYREWLQQGRGGYPSTQSQSPAEIAPLPLARLPRPAAPRVLQAPMLTAGAGSSFIDPTFEKPTIVPPQKK
jgi:hypothetical protein